MAQTLQPEMLEESPAFDSVVNICSKAFYFAQINSAIPSGLGPGWASPLHLLQTAFFLSFKYCDGKQRRYLYLASYVPFLPSFTFLIEVGMKF
jgi:hypothetical protein